MDQHHSHPVTAMVLTVLSIFSALFSAITLQGLQVFAICIAILSGLFAMRYHHLASVEKKLIIEEKKAALKKQQEAERS